MEEAPTPILLNETITESSKEYKLNLNKKDYLVKVILSDKIIINLQEIKNIYPQIYYKDLTLEAFYEINKLFKQYDTLEECYDCLLKFFEKNKVSISKNGDNFSIQFQINSLFGDYEEIIINLQKKPMSKNDIINNKLYEEINELKNKIKSLEEDTKQLRNIIESLQKENSDYKALIESRLSKLEQKNQEPKIELELDLDSKIITTKEEYNFITERLKKYFKKKFSLNLIYRASTDGDEPSDFHNKCDKKINVLVLYLTTKNVKFGGFSSIGFDSSNEGKTDLNSFIFNINNKKIYEAKESNQIGCFEANGPFFGRYKSAIYMYDNVNFLTEKEEH